MKTLQLDYAKNNFSSIIRDIRAGDNDFSMSDGELINS